MLVLIIDLFILVFVSLGFALLLKKTKFANVPYALSQIIIGIAFGLLAILYSEYGYWQGGLLINARDSGPLAAGLLFGGPAGIIAGIIGGVYRWFCVYWGGATFTRLACSLATILAGFISALLRKTLFNNKKPNIAFSFAISAAVEILHMLLILLLNMDEMSTAFNYVLICADTMIIGNALAVCLSNLAIDLLVEKKRYKLTKPEPILYRFSISLFLCVVIMFCLTGTITYVINTSLAKSEAKALLTRNIEDLNTNLNTFGISEHISTWRIGQTGGVVVGDTNTGEIVSVGKDGQSLDLNSLSVDGDYLEENKLYKATINGDDIYAEFDMTDDYLIIVYIPVQEADLSRNVTLYMTIFTEVIIFIVLFCVVYQIVRRQITHPLHNVNNGLKEITNGDLSTVINVRNSLEFSALSDDVNSTVDSLKDLIKDAENRVERELMLAHEIQKSAVPNCDALSNRNDFDIYALMDTAKEVGGDFYDVYFIDNNHIAFLIADVSGKGIPAAMFMMAAKTLIKGLADKGKSVDEVFYETNNGLCDGNEAGMFVTAWMGVVDLETGHLEYANAGHNPPLIYRKNGSFEYLKDKANFILAGMENSKYTKHELNLNPGDMIYLYTDGVTEAENLQHQLYGEERLKSILNESVNKTSSEICKAVVEDVSKHTDGANQSDDITMLCFELKQIQSLNSISVYPSDSSLEMIAQFVDKKLATLKISRKVRNKVQITVDEIFSNIKKYGNASKATISFGFENEQLSIDFLDDGDKFDPITKEDPDVTLSAEERQIGGLGIYMVKNLSTSCTYEYVDGQNHLNVVFDLRNN